MSDESPVLTSRRIGDKTPCNRTLKMPMFCRFTVARHDAEPVWSCLAVTGTILDSR